MDVSINKKGELFVQAYTDTEQFALDMWKKHTDGKLVLSLTKFEYEKLIPIIGTAPEDGDTPEPITTALEEQIPDAKDRETIKAELDALKIPYNGRAATTTLSKLLLKSQEKPNQESDPVLDADADIPEKLPGQTSLEESTNAEYKFMTTDELGMLTQKFFDLTGHLDADNKHKGPALMAQYKVKKLSELKGENLHNYILAIETEVVKAESAQKGAS